VVLSKSGWIASDFFTRSPNPSSVPLSRFSTPIQIETGAFIGLTRLGRRSFSRRASPVESMLGFEMGILEEKPQDLMGAL
jgi:hypothetical protein